MDKKLIKNLAEYRAWAFEMHEKHETHHVDQALGLNIDYDCWDYNDKNEPIDEQGNVIPDVTAETVKLEKWVEELVFPVVVVYWIEKDHDRHGDVQIIALETVSLSEFNV